MPTDIIQWFPGHMARTRRLIGENLKAVDAVFELRDARLPLSSANPEIDRLTEGKPRLLLLNKSSLCDPSTLDAWTSRLSSGGNLCIATDCKTGEGIKSIPAALRELCSDRIKKYEDKGMKGRKLKVMVLGIPNVGKSTLINRLSGGNRAKTEDRPGVTKEVSWYPTGLGFDLMDFPGLLWPRFDSRETAENLAISGAIKDEIFDNETVAVALMRKLRLFYPALLKARYKLGDNIDLDDTGLSDYDLFIAAAKKRGMLLRGGEADTERFADALLDDFRSCRIGRITLDRF